MSNRLSSSGPIRVGVIGTGGMGGRHVRNLTDEVTGSQVVALMDVDAARMAEVAAACGASHTFSDARALIRHPAVDAVVIAAPDRFHAELTAACLAAGKPVLCEKPLAADAEEARRIVETEITGGRRLIQVGLMRQFDPAHLRVKELIASGALGKAVAFRGIHINSLPHAPRMAEEVITNSVIHDLHSARWMMSDEVTRVYVSYVPYAGHSPETARLILIQLQYRSGAVGQIECNAEAGYGYEVDVRVTGENGAAETNSLRSPVVSYNNQRGQWVEEDWLQRFDTAYIHEVRAWIRALQTGVPIGPTAWDGYVSMLLADACIESAKTGKPVDVDIPPMAALYAAANG
ncbi:MAG: Gfo/Idh/MocA family oxidoreductase [Caldilineaceae bacterium]|nr:Gfo/Idh/MocA family oxidoreductase [Caldilineaceae bacterium]